MSEAGLRVISGFGLLAMLAIAWAISSDRRNMPWHILPWGLGLQFGLALLLLHTTLGRGLFVAANAGIVQLISYTNAGTQFVFGSLMPAAGEFSFALQVLPTLIFLSCLFAVLYHWGVAQWVVGLMARGLSRSMRISAAESLAAVANIFVGMTEAPLMVRPYLERMTRSELFTVMSTGMATIAGSVLVAYAEILGRGEFPGHLVTASLLSAPAAILISKIMIPERETPATLDSSAARVSRSAVNTIDAASQGARTGLRLAVNVGALLVAFVALVHMVNAGLAELGALAGIPNLSFERILGWLCAPLALLMGIPWHEAQEVGALLGVRNVLNEFIAYQQLGELIANGQISQRSAVISSYALCGFANFGSIAILIGGLGGLVPARRPEIARLGLRSIAAGTLATLMTGCLAGLLL